jgi:prolyl 4-hydroxylase
MSFLRFVNKKNYTETGFKKIRAPNSVMDLLNAHWKRNRDGLYDREEIWPAGSIYVNHWESPTYMSAVEDTNTRGGGYALKKAVWDAVKPVVEAWTGMEQKPISMYGIRAYTEGAILSPHVDRLPLVSSCIINVDQDVDEDWPLEVYDRHDRAVNITMQPGDLVLYESGSLMHGRPFPLKGRFYANIFIHFEPTGRKLGDTSLEYLDELDDILPPYLLAGSPESDNWARKNPHGWSKPLPSAPIQQVTSPEGHRAAAIGDLARLSKLAQTNRRALHAKDENGWQPLHEAVRADNKEAVELLIKHGANKDARVGKKGEGASALNLALDFLSVGADTVNYLMSIGAQNIEPDL